MAMRWLEGDRTRGELRNFARSLVPLSLYALFTQNRSTKQMFYDALKPRRKTITEIVKDACNHRRNHPLPEPPPPPLSVNTFFDSGGLYSTSDRPPPSHTQVYHPPPAPPSKRSKQTSTSTTQTPIP